MYNAAKFKDLLSGNDDQPIPIKKRPKVKKSERPLTKKEKIKKQLAARKELRNQQYWKEQDRLLKETEKRVKSLVERKAKRREEEFQRNQKGVEDAQNMSRDIGEWLRLQDEMEHRKKMSRYHEWEENVYGKIKRDVAKKMKQKPPGQTERMRRREYERFLRTTNEKESLFLDIIIASDYDPFVPNRNSIKYDGRNMDDPTKRVIRKYNREKNMVPALDRVEAKKESRGMLNVRMWGSGKIESTPHGHFAKLMATGGDDNASSQRESARDYQSTFHLDHFDYPVGKDAIDREFPKGKRTNFENLPFQVRR